MTPHAQTMSLGQLWRMVTAVSRERVSAEKITPAH